MIKVLFLLLIGPCGTRIAAAEDFPTPEELQDRSAPGMPPGAPPPVEEPENYEVMDGEEEDIDDGSPPPSDFRGRFGRRNTMGGGGREGFGGSGGSPGGAGFRGSTATDGVVFRLVPPENENLPKSPRMEAYEKYKKYQGKF